MKHIVIPSALIVLAAVGVLTVTHKSVVKTAPVTPPARVQASVAPPAATEKTSSTSKLSHSEPIVIPDGVDGHIRPEEQYSAARDVRQAMGTMGGDTPYTTGDASAGRKRQRLGYTSAGTFENAAGTSSTVIISSSPNGAGQAQN